MKSQLFKRKWNSHSHWYSYCSFPAHSHSRTNWSFSHDRNTLLTYPEHHTQIRGSIRGNDFNMEKENGILIFLHRHHRTHIIFAPQLFAHQHDTFCCCGPIYRTSLNASLDTTTPKCPIVCVLQLCCCSPYLSSYNKKEF